MHIWHRGLTLWCLDIWIVFFLLYKTSWTCALNSTLNFSINYIIFRKQIFTLKYRLGYLVIGSHKLFKPASDKNQDDEKRLFLPLPFVNKSTDIINFVNTLHHKTVTNKSIIPQQRRKRILRFQIPRTTFQKFEL